MVLSIDEKSQIQALDRTHDPDCLSSRPSRHDDHDYKRMARTLAALDVLEGKVVGRCMQRHRHQEFIRFLKAVEKTVPATKAMHVILDNYAAHKHPKVIAWLARHPRVTFHFTPTSASWLNAVEGFFATLTKRRAPTRHLPRCRRPPGLDQPLRGRAQRRPEAVPIKGRSRRHHRAAARGHQTLDLFH